MKKLICVKNVHNIRNFLIFAAQTIKNKGVMRSFDINDVRREYVSLRDQLRDYESQYQRITANDGHTARVRGIEFSFKNGTVEVFRPSKRVPLLLAPFVKALKETIDGLRQSMATIREEFRNEINFEEYGEF